MFCCRSGLSDRILIQARQGTGATCGECKFSASGPYCLLAFKISYTLFMQEEYKRASWLELFYDVAFVALVAQLTYLTAENHHSVSDFLNIFIIGYSIFIAWWATTANRNLQPSETAVDKLFVQAQMIGAFLMSITMAATFQGDYLGFFLTLGGVRIIQALMLIKMYVKYPNKRPVTYNILQGFLAGSLLWIVSAFVPAPYHFVLAGAALVVDIFTPVTRGKGNTVRYLNVYHLQERLGLFLMLVIGESMIVVALANTATTTLSVNEPAILFSGLALMVSLWWLYFEHSDAHQGVRPKNLFVFLHAHGFLFGSIIALSVGYKLTLKHPDVVGLLFVLAGAVGVAVTIGIIRAMLYKLYGRVIIVVGLVFLLFTTLVFFGVVEELFIEAIVASSLLFMLIAYFDYQGFFNRVSKKINSTL